MQCVGWIELKAVAKRIRLALETAPVKDNRVLIMALEGVCRKYLNAACMQ